MNGNRQQFGSLVQAKMLAIIICDSIWRAGMPSIIGELIHTPAHKQIDLYAKEEAGVGASAGR